MPKQILDVLYALCSTGQHVEAFWLLEEHLIEGPMPLETYVEYKQALREDFPEFREYAQER